MNPGPVVPARTRVVVDNDWSGDPDGLVALAHHLLSPGNDVRVVTGSFVDPRFPVARPTAAHAAENAQELVELVGGDRRPTVHAGAERPFRRGTAAASTAVSAAAEAIVAELRRPDPLPSVVVCGGPLTNVAHALEQDPGIADEATLVWIGGTSAAAPFEYNHAVDPAAAEFVLAAGWRTVHQFPVEAYRRVTVSTAELQHVLGGGGRLGSWLWSRFTDPPEWVEVGGVWQLGDSPPVLVTALTTDGCRWRTGTTTTGGEHRVYTEVDTRLLWGDLGARLALADGLSPR